MMYRIASFYEREIFYRSLTTQKLEGEIFASLDALIILKQCYFDQAAKFSRGGIIVKFSSSKNTNNHNIQYL